jgi:hypothetical protein
MSRSSRVAAAVAAGVLGACGGGGGPGDASETFLAFSSTFAPFRGWPSFHSDGPADDGTFPPDVLGPRTQYINLPPPHGASEFPVGTVIVEARESGSQKITPSSHLGLDSWLRGEYPQHPAPMTRTFGLGPAVYLGPAAMVNFGKLWWALGVYARVTDTSHDLQPGEPYGPIYVRSMIGYDL